MQRSLPLCFLLVLSCFYLGYASNTTVERQGSLTYPAVGHFYRWFASADTLNNNAAMPFASTSPVTNPTYFSLSDGNVIVRKTGVYFVTAEATFTGSVQMRFKIDNYAVVNSVVGMSITPNNGRVLASYAILTIDYPDTVLKWENPSGSTNNMVAQSNARITIIGIDNVDDSSDFSRYGEYFRIGNHSGFGHIYDKSEVKGMGLEMGPSHWPSPPSGGAPTVAPPNPGVFAILQQDVPIVPTATSGKVSPATPNTPSQTGWTSVRSSNNVGFEQNSAFGLVGFTSDYPMWWVEYQPIPISHMKVGGSQNLYSNAIFLEVTDLVYNHFYTMGDGTFYPISQYGSIPFLVAESATTKISKVSDTNIKLQDAGTYLVVIKAEFLAPNYGETTYKLMVGATEVSGSRTKSSSGQSKSVHLVKTYASDRILYVQVTTQNTDIRRLYGTFDYTTSASLTIVRLC